MSKYDIKFTDLFAGFEEVMKMVVERSLDQNTATFFDETEKVFDDQLDKLNASLTAVDSTLADAEGRAREDSLPITQPAHPLRPQPRQARRDHETADRTALRRALPE